MGTFPMLFFSEILSLGKDYLHMKNPVILSR